VWNSREQFDSKTKGILRQGFNRRLSLASRPYNAPFALGLGDPSLEPDDAETLRVSHAYRNDVYHEDRHPGDAAHHRISGASLSSCTAAFM
jgi:hypothetical protein